MTSKKELKKKFKKMKAKISQLDDTVMGTLWAMQLMTEIYDRNMELIQKTFGLIVDKFDSLVTPSEEPKEEVEEDGTG